MITPSRAGEICDNKLLGLAEDFRERANEWIEKLRGKGILPLVYCGYRSMDEQRKLYAKGRSEPGKIVTYAKEGQSYHNYGLAFDWVPLKENPKNNGYYESDWENDEAYEMGEEIGKTLNLVSLKWETGHLQDGRYKTFRDIPSRGIFRAVQLMADDFDPAPKSIIKRITGWRSR